MRKLRMFGLMVVAMCALGALFVASASAEEPGEFLANGVLITEQLAADLEGELLFESLKTGSAIFLCSGIFHGVIENTAQGGLYEVTSLLELSTMPVTASDTTATIACTPDTGSICSKAAVSPTNLPWDSDLELTTTVGDYLLVSLANANGVGPGYFLLCEVFGLDNTELCEVLPGTTQLVENDATHIIVPTGSSPTPDAKCSSDTGEEETGGLVVDEALLSLVSGETLAASL